MLANKFARLHFILIVLGLAMVEVAQAQSLPAATPPATTWVFPPGVTDLTIPTRFSTTGEIAIRMTVNGRGLDLTLDTGMDRNMLDSSVFKAIALQQADDSSATISTVQFGGATMRGLPVNKGSFFRRDEDGNLIVGVLGYDFLKAAVVKIDYDHQQVHIIDPTAFHAPQPAMQYSLYPGQDTPCLRDCRSSHRGLVRHRYRRDGVCCLSSTRARQSARFYLVSGAEPRHPGFVLSILLAAVRPHRDDSLFSRPGSRRERGREELGCLVSAPEQLLCDQTAGRFDRV